jgi:alcohol dehydrogenase
MMMRELTFVAPKQIEFRDRPRPRIEDGRQALVRPIAVARCDLDLAFAQGRVPVQGPFGLGHECAGEVIEVGDAVRGVAPGDRVVVPFQISCGACVRCLARQSAHCTTVPSRSAYGLGPLGGTQYGGAIADVLCVPFADAMLVKLPAGLDPVIAAALGDNAVDGFRTVHDALARAPGARVLIAGGGAVSIAMYAVSAARACGAREVVYVDAAPDRARLAEQLGATAVREAAGPELRIGLFPIVVDATASEPGLRFCLASTDAEGTCTSVGIYWSDVAMPLFEMYTRGIMFITGRVDARRELPAALQLAASGAFALAPIATTRVAWDQAPQAWPEPATKLVVVREAA